MNKKNIIIFTLILLVAIIIRYYKLGTAPAGLYLDEAAQGYNAYSILMTGKDEFGKTFPVIFRSFADFKTPVYIYLVVPLIPLFGLTKFTVRFPSFLFSILTFPVLYFLIKKIAPKKLANPLALITSFLLAINPWHILFGRTDFECNVALFFFLAGTYFFYKGLEKPKQLILSAIFLSIAIPAYHAQRIITPLMIIILFVKYRQILLSQTHKKYLLTGVIVGFLLLLPTLKIAMTPGFLARATGLNIFSQDRQKPWGYIDNCTSPFCLIGNNTLFLNIKEFFSLYSSYFSPRNMFFLGDYERRISYPDLSPFYLWQFPFYIFGLFLIARKKALSHFRLFVISLLFLSPIPAALTRDPYSTIRSFQMVIPVNIIIALALVESYQYLKKTFRNIGSRLFDTSLLIPVLIVTLYSIAKLYSSVFILNEYYRAAEWNYGFEDVASAIKEFDPNLPVVMDNSRIEPYSQLLFFLKYDPVSYQKENFEVTPAGYYTNLNRVTTKKIGKIVTRPINWNKDLKNEQYLIGDSLAISEEQIKEHHLSLIKNIKYPDGSSAFIITKTNPSE